MDIVNMDIINIIIKIFIFIVIFFLIYIVIFFLIYTVLPTLFFRLKNFMLFKENKREKILYLTFDDGPDPCFTTVLLDLLRKENIGATFFVVGNFAKNNPKIIKTMKEDGHKIGLHSLKHKRASWMGPVETILDLKNSISIMNKLDVDTEYYRPPWGTTNIPLLFALKKENKKMVFWNVMAQDWEKNTTSHEIIKKLTKRVASGKIICLHDGRGENKAPLKTIEALKTMIPLWKSQGYVFLKIGEDNE